MPKSVSLQYERLFDSSTGLPGIALLLDRVEMALVRALRIRRQVGVLWFAEVRSWRDGADCPFSGIPFRSVLRLDDTVARVSERGFVVVCNDLEDEEDAPAIAQRVLGATKLAGRLGIAVSRPSEPARVLLTRAAHQAGVTNWSPGW